jgi:hypothetical protein
LRGINQAAVCGFAEYAASSCAGRATLLPGPSGSLARGAGDQRGVHTRSLASLLIRPGRGALMEKVLLGRDSEGI